MNQETQLIIGLDALEHVIRTHGGLYGLSTGTAKGIENLRDEVECGSSTLLLNMTGEPERVTSFVALQLEDDHGNIFVQIGKFEDAEVVPACHLPGGKVERGEIPRDAVQRLLETELLPLKGSVRILRTNQEIVTKESKGSCVRTKYVRTTCFSEMSDPLVAMKIGFAKPQTPQQLASSPHCRRRAQSREASNVAVEVPSPKFTDIFENDVYVFGSPEKASFFTWVPTTFYETLGSPSCEAILQDWLSGLEFTPDGMPFYL